MSARGLNIAAESVILAAAADSILTIDIGGITFLPAAMTRGILVWRVNCLPPPHVSPRESLMSRLAFRVIVLALGLAAGCASAVAEESAIAASLHPWGQFEPGTWKMVRVVTETLDEQGQVVSTSRTDTKTTLLEVSNDSVTLEVEACMEVAGKRFQVEPQTVKEGFHGEMAGSDDPTEGTGRWPDHG